MNRLDEADLKEFGDNLKKVREEKKLTQADVANISKVNANYYACIERGEVNPSYKKLRQIVKALNIKSSDILPF